MLQIAICDDERLHREHTARLVERAAAEYLPEVETFASAQALLLAICESAYLPDIAILDIQMDGMDGIELAARLNSAAPDCRIIFLTSFLAYATDVYDARHAYFILKPELEARIGPALSRAIEDMGAAPVSLRFREGGRIHALPARSVLLLERRLRKTRIVCEAGEHLAPQPPAQLLGGLDGTLFIRCHQSFWVNAEQVSSMAKALFVMQNGEQVPISRSYAKTARLAYWKRLGG